MFHYQFKVHIQRQFCALFHERGEGQSEGKEARIALGQGMGGGLKVVRGRGQVECYYGNRLIDKNVSSRCRCKEREREVSVP